MKQLKEALKDLIAWVRSRNYSQLLMLALGVVALFLLFASGLSGAFITLVLVIAGYLIGKNEERIKQHVELALKPKETSETSSPVVA